MMRKLLGGWLVVMVIGLALATSASASTSVTVGCGTGPATGAQGLINAVLAADEGAAPSTIELTAGCTYTFTGAYQDASTPVISPSSRTAVGLEDWYGPSALPAIASTITIDGNGATLAAIQPSSPVQSTTGFNPDFRFFYVGADPTSTSTLDYATPGAGVLTLNDLTLSGGMVHGGDGTVDAGGGAGMGGAIFNQGTLSLNAVTVTGNHAIGGGEGSDDDGGGGGMATNGISDGRYGIGGGFGPGTFGGAAGSAGTSANSGGGGGFAITDIGQTDGAGGGPATGLGAASDDQFPQAGGDGSGSGASTQTYAHAGGAGGAFGSGGAANGQTLGGGGGVGGGSGPGSGGGFGGGGGVNGNGGFGGGDGPPIYTPTTPGFGAGEGGAGMGGAIFNMQGRVQITDSTMTANIATGGSGDSTSDQPGGDGLGGAIFNLNGTVNLRADTVDQNTASQGGGGVYNLGYYTNPSTADTPVASLAVKNSIIYNDGASDVQDNAPSTTSAGTNSSSATETDTTSDIGSLTTSATGQDTSSGAVTGNPQLAGLASNGGPGMATQLLGSGSVAIGAGSSCPTVDERGITSASSSCDIGAVQEVAPTVTITGPTASTYSLDQNVPAAYSCADPTGPGNPSCTGTVASGQAVDTSTAGQHTFSVTATSSDGLKSTVPVTYTVSQDTPTTSVACGPTSAAGSAQTCTATVSDTANPVNIPTGTVTFSSSGSAVLSPSSCVLSGGSCSVSYTPSQADTETVTGRYGGDTDDTASTGTTTATSTAPPATTTTTTTTTTATTTTATTTTPGLAVGPFTGAGLPPLVLGQTRTQASGLPEYQRTSAAPGLQLFFSGPGVTRAGIASAKMLADIHTNRHYLNEVVWILTSNPADSIHGITPGMTIVQAATHLHLPAAQKVGANDWYLAPDGTVTAMLRAQNGKVIEVGAAVRSLSDGSRHRRFGFLAGFS